MYVKESKRQNELMVEEGYDELEGLREADRRHRRSLEEDQRF